MNHSTIVEKFSTKWTMRLLYLTASALFACSYYLRSETALHPNPEILSPFTWKLPFQLRILVPAIEYLCKLAVPLPWSFYHIVFSILSTYLVLVSFEKLLLYFQIRYASILALTILYPLTWNYIILTHFFFASDIPSIAFFTFGLLFSLERRWYYFYPLFILALFNRESIIFVVPAYLLLTLPAKHDARSLKSPMGHVVVQLVLFFFVKELLLYIFRDHPGHAFDNMIAANVILLHFLAHGRFDSWEYVIVCFGGLHLLALLFVHWIPRRLRWLFLLFPIVGAVMFTVGWLLEVRIFNELVPIATLLAIAGSQGAFFSRIKRSPEPQLY